MGYSFTFWEPSESPHKNGFFSAVAAHPCVRAVRQIVHQGLLADRAQMGWELDRNLKVDTVVAPTKAEVFDIVEKSPIDEIHIFSGFRWHDTLVNGIDAVLRKGRNFMIMSEPRESEGIKGLARRVQSLVSESSIRQKVLGILAIGAHGPGWFASTGYGAEKIFPFAYFLPAGTGFTDEECGTDGAPLRISYLGRLEKAKGFELFLESVRYLTHDFDIRVAGTGSMAALAKNFTSSYGEYRFVGALPMSGVPRFLAETDILVQPSLTTNDGWGAVVSEALFSGAAVLTSDRVGAHMCLNEERGRYVSDLTPISLARAIDRMAVDFQFGPKERMSRSIWAKNHLSAEAGAEYLINIVNHLQSNDPRPGSFVTDEG